MPPNAANETAHALSDFKLFAKFPNCIKSMIWKEFYSQPRYFITYPVYRGRSREDEFEVPLEWALRPKGPQTSYHKTIDTQIDELSSFVASRIRPKFTITIPRMTVDEHQQHRIKTRRAKGKSKVAHANISWDFDFVHVAKAVPEGSGNLIPQVEWFSNIQNMVLDHDLFQKDISRGFFRNMITLTAFCLWESKRLLGSLRNLALQRVPWHRNQDSDTPLLCFQIRYLLREAPATPPQWKDLKVGVISQSPWLDIERHGGVEEVQWDRFMEPEDPHACFKITGDEITDTRVMFSELFSLRHTGHFLYLPSPGLSVLPLDRQLICNYDELVRRAFISGR
ncbi:hypothetical protein CGMCC3_g4629 [Colletotrichum fructicola]|uniref:Uncharacterized protein n=1 Tax=Colletotrichum fructicola (strain Nara gc5) TaxID=1213859 RepID=L2GDI5_COLFN|nr:uncharacterized protein CGMCC3_g4629 [Colletotrichum fructicola]KAE9579133.1 hypothetical protein CGMCC3_g4629 [Colletotrichum fructicola]KAF4488128.1 hypothetical protein CGGC5_v002797 [Colletotrichum fructicola Nara gc5]